MCVLLELLYVCSDTIMISSNISFFTLCSNFNCQIRSLNLGKLTLGVSNELPDIVQISCAFSQPQKTCSLLSNSNPQASQVELSITLHLHKIVFVGMMFLHARHVNDLTLLGTLRPQSVFQNSVRFWLSDVSPMFPLLTSVNAIL